MKLLACHVVLVFLIGKMQMFSQICANLDGTPCCIDADGNVTDCVSPATEEIECQYTGAKYDEGYVSVREKWECDGKSGRAKCTKIEKTCQPCQTKGIKTKGVRVYVNSQDNNGEDACLQTFAVQGPCKAHVSSWSYNQKTGKCEKFSYGGCQGNDNRFPMRQMCKDICGKPGPSSICKDNHKHCTAWKKYCTSPIFGGYLKKICQKSCNACPALVEETGNAWDCRHKCNQGMDGTKGSFSGQQAKSSTMRAQCISDPDPFPIDRNLESAKYE